MQHPTQNLRQQQLNFATRQDNENKTKSFRRTTGEISLVQRAQHIFAVTSKILVASASARDDFVDFRYLCQMLMTHEVDIFGLPAESGLDWKQHTPRNKCRQIMDDFWQHTRLVTSTSNVKCDLFTQFGGTCTGVTGKWSGRILEQGRDSHGLGRWSYIRLHGKNG